MKEDYASQTTVLNEHILEASNRRQKADKQQKQDYYNQKRMEEDREEAAQAARTRNLVANMNKSVMDTENVSINTAVVHVLGNYQSNASIYHF